jgi:hypothetical protein
MFLLIRTSTLIVALAMAGSALAQQEPTTRPHVTKHVSKPRVSPAPDGILRAGYQKYCGAHFVCYTGIPLNCAPDTRPYQDIANHECYCLRDSCPQ